MASSSRPATPIRVPKAAGTYTPQITDPGLRSEINTLLIQGGHITKIQEHITHALNASPTNWPTLIHTYALSLLRNGECHTFPELMVRVMEDIKADTDVALQVAPTSTTTTNGSSGKNGVVNGSNGKSKVTGRGEDGQSLALPQSVVEEGVRITKECLEVVCEFQP